MGDRMRTRTKASSTAWSVGIWGVRSRSASIISVSTKKMERPQARRIILGER